MNVVGNGSLISYRIKKKLHKICIAVTDQVGTLAQNGTSPNMGLPNKELTTLSILRPKVP